MMASQHICMHRKQCWLPDCMNMPVVSPSDLQLYLQEVHTGGKCLVYRLCPAVILHGGQPAHLHAPKAVLVVNIHEQACGERDGGLHTGIHFMHEFTE
jgi:hypothetical protein